MTIRFFITYILSKLGLSIEVFRRQFGGTFPERLIQQSCQNSKWFYKKVSGQDPEAVVGD